MAQIIYSLLALLMVMVLTMNMQRGIGRDQQEQSLNEVATQLTGVGTEVLELIGTQHFDWHTWNYANSRNLTNQDAEGNQIPASLQPYCGRIADNEEALKLSPAPLDPPDPTSRFGSCDEDNINDCEYIEGFDDLSWDVQREGFDYTVTVDVRYVDPGDFSVDSATPTFAKRVLVTIENPYLYLGDDTSNTFSLTVDRVFTYGCTTDYEYIPYVRETESCPSPLTRTLCSQWAW